MQQQTQTKFQFSRLNYAKKQIIKTKTRQIYAVTFYAGFVQFRMGNEPDLAPTIPKLCNSRPKPKIFSI